MRKIIVFEHITQDGVIQAPGGNKEDTSNHFTQGGWIFPFSDEVLGKEIQKAMKSSFDLLLGRLTYDIWQSYWPYHDGWPEANEAIKYVASDTLSHTDWNPSVIMKNDIISQIKTIKSQDGKDIHVWGSSQLLKTLFEHNLVDELCLFVYPISLGNGKKLFADESIRDNFIIVESTLTTKNVRIEKYKLV